MWLTEARGQLWHLEHEPDSGHKESLAFVVLQGYVGDPLQAAEPHVGSEGELEWEPRDERLTDDGIRHEWLRGQVRRLRPPDFTMPHAQPAGPRRERDEDDLRAPAGKRLKSLEPLTFESEPPERRPAYVAIPRLLERWRDTSAGEMRAIDRLIATCFTTAHDRTTQTGHKAHPMLGARYGYAYLRSRTPRSTLPTATALLAQPPPPTTVIALIVTRYDDTDGKKLLTAIKTQTHFHHLIEEWARQ